MERRRIVIPLLSDLGTRDDAENPEELEDPLEMRIEGQQEEGGDKMVPEFLFVLMLVFSLGRAGW